MRTPVLLFCMMLSMGMIGSSNEYSRALDRIARKVSKSMDQESKKVLIVDELHATGDDVCQLSTVISNDLEAKLTRKRRSFTLLDRSSLNESLELLDAADGFHDLPLLVQAGRLAKADVLMTGTYGRAENELILRVKLIDLETKEVLLALNDRSVFNEELESLCAVSVDDLPHSVWQNGLAVEASSDATSERMEASVLHRTGTLELINENERTLYVELHNGEERKELLIPAKESAHAYGLTEGIWKLYVRDGTWQERNLSAQDVLVLAGQEEQVELGDHEFRKRRSRGSGRLFEDVDALMLRSERQMLKALERIDRMLK